MKNVISRVSRSRVSRSSQLIVAGSLLAGSAMSMAADIDVSDTISTITSGVATVSSIGVAGLSIVVCVKIFKFVRSAI